MPVWCEVEFAQCHFYFENPSVRTARVLWQMPFQLLDQATRPRPVRHCSLDRRRLRPCSSPVPILNTLSITPRCRDAPSSPTYKSRFGTFETHPDNPGTPTLAKTHTRDLHARRYVEGNIPSTQGPAAGQEGLDTGLLRNYGVSRC